MAPIAIRMGGYGPPKDHTWKHVYFFPWVGKNYGTASRRLLILGESHYGDDDESQDFTRRLTKEIVRGHTTGRFWTQIAQTLTGKSRWDIDRKEFWNSVSFYNYVQEIVGGAARIAPTAEMFHRSESAFFEVLDQLKPTHLIATGRRLWYQMPRLVDENLKFYVAGQPYQYGEYSREWGRVLAMGIKHPSTAFNSCHWHPVVSAFLDFGRVHGNAN